MLQADLHCLHPLGAIDHMLQLPALLYAQVNFLD